MEYIEREEKNKLNTNNYVSELSKLDKSARNRLTLNAEIIPNLFEIKTRTTLIGRQKQSICPPGLNADSM